MLSIITLKKIQEGKGLERNGVKGRKGGLMEEVTLEQKLELARRRQERGHHHLLSLQRGEREEV